MTVLDFQTKGRFWGSNSQPKCAVASAYEKRWFAGPDHPWGWSLSARAPV